MKRVLYILTALLFCSATNAQTSDSTSKNKGGFFGKWRVAGISLSGGLLSPSKTYGIDFFKPILSSDLAKEKYSFDIAEMDKYDGHLTGTRYHETSVASLRLIFKPKNIPFNKLLSYFEISMGLTYSNHRAWSSVDGFILINSNYKKFATSYNLEYRNIALDGLLTLQTPSILSRVAIYSGIGVFGGTNFDSWSTSNPSKQEVGIDNFNRQDDTVTYPFGEEKGFSKADWLLGWYIPVGLKVNVSARSNLFLEYTISNRTLFFQNKFSYTNSNTGLIIGFRYKFPSKPKKEKKSINTPSKTPEPFY